MLGLVRLVLAGLFVYVCLLAPVGLLANDDAPAWVVVPLALLSAAGAMMLVTIIDGWLFGRAGSIKSLEQVIAELDDCGRLVRQRFHATRAFQVEECEDEGLHYYIELADGRVLYLEGQYLYDYAPVEDHRESQARSFPCTEFEILRDQGEGYTLAIQCAGTPIEPEVIAPPFTLDECERGLPADGEIIADRSYESIKCERTGGSGSPVTAIRGS